MLCAMLKKRPLMFSCCAVFHQPQFYGKAGVTPKGAVENIESAAFYLESVDELYRRQYARAE